MKPKETNLKSKDPESDALMPKQKSSLPLTIGAAGLLIGGGIAAYLALNQRTLLPGLPVGANIIPQDALLTVSVSTDAGKWQQLRKFGTAPTQAELDKYLQRLRDRILSVNGYNYQRDVQPWVGKEITLAFLTNPRSTLKPANNQQSVLIVLPIANAAAAKQALQPKQLAPGKWITRNYKGLQITQTQGVPDKNYAVTVIDQRFVVVSDNPKATEKAIDAYQSGVTLAKTPGYTNAINKITTSDRFAQVYINVPAASTVNTARALAPQNLAQLQQDQGLASTVTLEPEGLRFKGIYWLKPNSQRQYTVANTAIDMQRRLPAETLMMLSGGNLQRLWQDYLLFAQSNPLAPISPENLRTGVKSLTGLNIDRDFFSWMNGEFALSVIPAAPQIGSPQDFALSLVLMAKTNDKTAAKQSFQQLEQIIQNRYQFRVEKAQIKGETVSNWIAPFGTLTATRGWLDERTAFLALGAPVAERLLPNPSPTLASTPQFQKSVPAVNPVDMQFFLNSNSTVKNLPLPQFFPGQQVFLQATRAIGATSVVSDARSIRYDVFVEMEGD